MARAFSIRSSHIAGVTVALVLIAGACGGGDTGGAPTGAGEGSSGSGGTQEDATGSDQSSDSGGTAASGGQTTGAQDDASGDGSGGTQEGVSSSDQSAADGGAQAADEADRPEPQYGGTLRYAVESTTLNPWLPSRAVCAIACQAVSRSIFDTLMLLDDEGVPQPNLLASMEPNDDFTVWTLKVRDGITFHDGTPLDGAAVAQNLVEARGGLITSFLLSDVDTIESSGDTVTVTTKRPWASLPVALAGQPGYMASPAWLDGVAAGTASTTEPVGTGPFVYESFTPEEFTAVRNDDYWREGLPYLDRIEFPVIGDDEARVRALRSGQIQATHGITDARSVELAEEGFRELNDIGRARESSATLINSQVITDVRVRRALAMAINREAQMDAFNAGYGKENISNGPFAPGSIGYLEDTGYPGRYDPDEARRLIAEVEAETGPVVINLKVVGDPSGTVQSSLTQQFFEDIGVDVELDQVDQASLILQVVTGQYEVAAWRWYGFPDPDMMYPFFHSDGIIADGISSNFHRAADPVVDEQLAIIRENPDHDARRQAAEALNRRLGEQAYILWNNWVTWRIVHRPEVHDVGGPYPLPDGGVGMRIGLGGGGGNGGDHQFAQIWIEQ